MRSKKIATQGTASRKSARAPIGPMWDKPSLQEFDGRANTREPNEADENGKWNKLGKNRPAVVVSKYSVRKVK